MTFTTIIRAQDNEGKINTWSGPRIQAISFGDAEAKCKELYPYAMVDGLLWAEIDDETGEKDKFIFWN